MRQSPWDEAELLGQGRGPGTRQRSWAEAGLYPSLKEAEGAAGAGCWHGVARQGSLWLWSCLKQKPKGANTALKPAGLVLAQAWMAAEVTQPMISHVGDSPAILHSPMACPESQIPGAKAASGRSHRQTCCFCCSGWPSEATRTLLSLCAVSLACKSLSPGSLGMAVLIPSLLQCPQEQEAAPAPSQGCHQLRAPPVTLCECFPILVAQQCCLSHETPFSRHFLGDGTAGVLEGAFGVRHQLPQSSWSSSFGCSA